MYGLFKVVLYGGVAAGLIGLAMQLLPDQPIFADLPANTQPYLTYGGLALIIIGLVGRTATKPTEGTWE